MYRRYVLRGFNVIIDLILFNEMSKTTLQYVKIHHTVLFYLKRIDLWNLMTCRIKYDMQDLMRASLKKTQR